MVQLTNIGQYSFFRKLKDTKVHHEFTQFMLFQVDCFVNQRFPFAKNILPQFTFDRNLIHIYPLQKTVLSYFIFNGLQQEANHFIKTVLNPEIGKNIMNLNIDITIQLLQNINIYQYFFYEYEALTNVTNKYIEQFLVKEMEKQAIN